MQALKFGAGDGSRRHAHSGPALFRFPPHYTLMRSVRFGKSRGRVATHVLGMQ